MVKLLHQCLFLVGNSVPPTLAMWIAGVRFAHDEEPDSRNFTTKASGRPINYSYTHKRILYAQGLKTMIAILSSLFLFRATSDNGLNNSLDMDHLQSRMLLLSNSILSRIKAICQLNLPPLFSRKIKTEASTSCSICNAVNASMPYRVSPCGHIFCYVCLRAAAIDNADLKCHQCGQFVQSSCPCIPE